LLAAGADAAAAPAGLSDLEDAAAGDPFTSKALGATGEDAESIESDRSLRRDENHLVPCPSAHACIRRQRAGARKTSAPWLPMAAWCSRRSTTPRPHATIQGLGAGWRRPSRRPCRGRRRQLRWTAAREPRTALARRNRPCQSRPWPVASAAARRRRREWAAKARAGVTEAWTRRARRLAPATAQLWPLMRQCPRLRPRRIW